MKYTLYKRPRAAKKGTKWQHVGYLAYDKKTAVRVFQNKLLANAFRQLEPEFEYQLRPAMGA